MPVAEDSIMEVRIGYIANEQQCYNVLHYYVLGGSGEGDDERGWQSRMANWFYEGRVTDGRLLKEMRDIMSEDVYFNTIAAQLIYPDVRYRATTLNVDTLNDGLVASPCNAQNVQACITKAGELGTRNNIGAFHVGGLPESFYTGGKIEGASITALDTVASQLLDQFSVTLEGATTTWALGILNKEPIPDTDPVRYQIQGITPVVDVSAKDTLRVMRRRTVRLGI